MIYRYKKEQCKKQEYNAEVDTENKQTIKKIRW